KASAGTNRAASHIDAAMRATSKTGGSLSSMKVPPAPMLREPLKIASPVGRVKPRKRRTRQNHIVRRVSLRTSVCSREIGTSCAASLRSTHPTFELSEVPLIQPGRRQGNASGVRILDVRLDVGRVRDSGRAGRRVAVYTGDTATRFLPAFLASYNAASAASINAVNGPLRGGIVEATPMLTVT